MSETKPAVQARPSPNLGDFPDAPRIMLAGEEWPIPPLGPRQNRVIEPLVYPLLTKLYPKFVRAQDLMAKIRAAADGVVPAELVGELNSFSPLSEEDYDAALRIVGAALSRAHVAFRRGFKPEDPTHPWTPTEAPLLDMDGVTSQEIIGAILVIVNQTGLARKPKPGAEAAPPEK